MTPAPIRSPRSYRLRSISFAHCSGLTENTSTPAVLVCLLSQPSRFLISLQLGTCTVSSLPCARPRSSLPTIYARYHAPARSRRFISTHPHLRFTAFTPYRNSDHLLVMGPEEKHALLPTRARFTWDIKTVPWSDGVGDQTLYAQTVHHWLKFYNRLPKLNSNRIAKNNSGIVLLLHLFWNTATLCRTIRKRPRTPKKAHVFSLIRCIKKTLCLSHSRSARSYCNCLRAFDTPTSLSVCSKRASMLSFTCLTRSARIPCLAKP